MQKNVFMNAALGFLTLASIALIAQPNRTKPVNFLLLSSIGSALALSMRNDTNTMESGSDLWEALTNVHRLADGSYPPNQEVAVSPPSPTMKPKSIQLAKRAIDVQPQPQDTGGVDVEGRWIDEGIKNCWIVPAKSGSGKTNYLLSIVYRILIKYDRPNLMIIDLDYGHAHENSEPNWWYGLPAYDGTNLDEAVIFTTPEHALVAIQTFGKEFQKRINTRGDNGWKFDSPFFMVIDEENQLFNNLVGKKDKEGDQKHQFISFLDTILTRGKKQGMFVNCGMQFLQVPKCGIDEVALQQYSAVVLGPSAKDKKVLSRLGLVGDDQKPLMEEYQKLKSQGYDYLAVVKGDNQEFNVRVLPFFAPDKVAKQFKIGYTQENNNPYLGDVASEALLALMSEGDTKTALTNKYGGLYLDEENDIKIPSQRRGTDWKLFSQAFETLEQIN